MQRVMTQIYFLAVMLVSLPLGLLGQQPSFAMPRPNRPILARDYTQTNTTTDFESGACSPR